MMNDKIKKKIIFLKKNLTRVCLSHHISEFLKINLSKKTKHYNFLSSDLSKNQTKSII